MGLRVTPIIDVVECTHWSVPSETPADVFAFVWDVRKGGNFGALDPPNLRVFRMPHVPGFPCTWAIAAGVGEWTMQFTLTDVASGLFLEHKVNGQNSYFMGTLAVSPYDMFALFTNFYQVAFGNWGFGGFGMVYWGTGLVALAKEFGLDHVNDLMFEVFTEEDLFYVVKFCSRTLATNVSMRIDR